MIYKMNIRPGDLKMSEWQRIVSKFYMAASGNDVERLGECFDEFADPKNKSRFDLITPEDNELILSSRGQKIGNELSFNIDIDITPTHLLFQLSRFATGEDRNIIAHLVSINGKLHFYKPFDKRILRDCKGDISTVHGIDLMAIDKGATITFKEFLGDSAFISFDNITVIEPDKEMGESNCFIAYWLLLKQLVDKNAKRFPDYSLGDLVRVTVGDDPVDFVVDSNQP